MSKKNVLITGSEGFIGSHLTELMVRKGYNVTALVLYNSFGSWGWLEDLPNEIKKEVNVKLGDVTDADFVNTICENFKTFEFLYEEINNSFHFFKNKGFP